MSTKQQQQEALEFLRHTVSEGATIYTVIRSVSRSGMSRRIDVLMFKGTHKYYLTTWMATLGIAGMRQSMTDWQNGRGASIPGCGMDMGYHAVDSLCHRLFGKSAYDANVRHEWI